MRILVVGGTGTIGSAIVSALAMRHEVVTVGYTKGSYQIDLASPDSITRCFQAAGRFDALISASGRAVFAPLVKLTDTDFQLSLSNKLMGQVNLIRLGLPFGNEGASFTLTSGVLSREPIVGSAAISLVNAGLEGFVRAAALELPRGMRINVVSPPWVTETLLARNMDPSIGLPASAVAQAYVASVEGSGTGQVLDPRTLPR